MEVVLKQKEQTLSIRLSVKLFESVMKKMTKGKLVITYPDQSVHYFGNSQSKQSEQKNAEINIHDWQFFIDCAKYGDIGFGESYMLGHWETPSVYDIIKWVILNIEAGVISGPKRKLKRFNFFKILNRLYHLYNDNTPKGAKRNIQFHYDLSNQLFELFLDPNMVYSSAYFKNPTEALEQAQINKFQMLADKLQIKSSDHVLEIGGGWGSFARYLATHYGCKVTSITISKQQYDYSVNKLHQLKLDHLIEIKLIDFRDLTGQFDKIASIEMMEALGHKHLKPFFQKCHQLLKPNGVLALQAITCPDARYDQFKDGIDWIQKHIFPGSLLLSVQRMTKVMSEVSDLQLLEMNDFGLHYAKTLRMWNQQFHTQLNEIKSLGFDDVFIRKWRYYLEYCEAAFFMRNISVVQMSFTRPNNTQLVDIV